MLAALGSKEAEMKIIGCDLTRPNRRLRCWIARRGKSSRRPLKQRVERQAGAPLARSRFRRSAPGIAANTRACGDAQYVSYLRGSLLRNEVMIASKESNLMTYQGLQVRAEEMGITRRWAAWEKCSAEGHYFGTTATNPPLRYCQRCFYGLELEERE